MKRSQEEFDVLEEKTRQNKKTTEKEVNDFILELQTTCPKSMWPDVLKIKYDDHQVDRPRQKILLEPVTQFIQNLTRQEERYEEDLLSNHSAIHITGTEEQVITY